METKEQARKLEYDERRKILTVFEEQSTEFTKATMTKEFNEKGIKQLRTNIESSKSKAQEVVNRTEKLVEELKEQEVAIIKKTKEPTDEQKEFIEKLKEVQKFTELENVREKIKQQENALKSYQDNLKTVKSDLHKIMQKAKLK